MKKPVVVFENYEYKYRSQKKPTLQEINLTIYEGERVIIVGASGSGKSTLAHCINGLNPFSYPGVQKGSLKLFGQEVSQLGIFGVSKYVGTVLQDTDGQFIGMTVLEDIAFAMENDRVNQEEMKVRTFREAEKVHLTDKLEAAPHDLSGGQKQRVSLAGVLVNKVPLLLFDEPLANLDPATGKEAMVLIEEIQRNTNTTVIIIEHRLEDALDQGADRIVLMEEGRIKADCTPQQLFCTNLLQKAGIREPLFLTALTYAGINLQEEMGLANIRELTLKEREKEQVCRWFYEKEEISCNKKSTPLLEVNKLCFGYEEGKNALSEISFTIEQGEMVALVGQNGAGKSTLAKLLCGFERQQKGEIYWKGKDISDFGIKKRAGYIGYVMQNPNQMISKPMVWEEVSFALELAGREPSYIKEKTEEILKVCGLYQFRNWPVSALSYGQKKRVTIASVLVQDPEMIILDEPTAGQDYGHYTEIMEFLVSLNQRGITILMITHDMHLMLEYTKRCLVCAKGRLIGDTSPSLLFVDDKLLEEANLKKTSLFGLAKLCDLPPKEFIDRFIEQDSKIRKQMIRQEKLYSERKESAR